MNQNEIFLLIDDSENDVMLARNAFAKANVPNPLQSVNSGEEALLYLSGEGKFADRQQFPMPTVVLLDLKMPDKSGFEVLEWVRSQHSLRDLCVIVLTGLEKISDVDRAYKLGATSFLVKPLDVERLNELMQTLGALRRRAKNS